MTSAPGVVGACSRTSPSVRPTHEAHPLTGRISQHSSAKLRSLLCVQPFEKAHPKGEQKVKDFRNTAHARIFRAFAAASSAFFARPTFTASTLSSLYSTR